MAGLKTREFAKKDMNFFSEFTQSSQAFARASGWIIIGAIAAVAITVLICIWKAISLGVLTAQVKAYDDKFATPEYQQLAVDAQDLAEENATISEYNYVIQTMNTRAKKDTGAEFNIIRDIEQNIPSDTIILEYDLDHSSLRIQGYSFNYYSPTEMINMMKNNNDVNLKLTNENLKVERLDPSQLGSAEEMANNFINAYYVWEFTASLQTESAVTVSCIGPNSMLLKNLDTQWVKTGDSFTLEGIGQIVYAGKAYTLDSILIDGAALTPDELAKAKLSGEYKLFVTDDTKVDVYFIEVTTTTEGA